MDGCRMGTGRAEGRWSEKADCDLRPTRTTCLSLHADSALRAPLRQTGFNSSPLLERSYEDVEPPSALFSSCCQPVRRIRQAHIQAANLIKIRVPRPVSITVTRSRPPCLVLAP